MVGHIRNPDTFDMVLSVRTVSDSIRVCHLVRRHFWSKKWALHLDILRIASLHITRGVIQPAGSIHGSVQGVEYDEEDSGGEHQNLTLGVGEPRMLGMAVRTRPVTNDWGEVRTRGPSHGFPPIRKQLHRSEVPAIT